jgi:hypothetical protein
MVSSALIYFHKKELKPQAVRLIFFKCLELHLLVLLLLLVVVVLLLPLLLLLPPPLLAVVVVVPLLLQDFPQSQLLLFHQLPYLLHQGFQLRSQHFLRLLLYHLYQLPLHFLGLMKLAFQTLTFFQHRKTSKTLYYVT